MRLRRDLEAGVAAVRLDEDREGVEVGEGVAATRDGIVSVSRSELEMEADISFAELVRC